MRATTEMTADGLKRGRTDCTPYGELWTEQPGSQGKLPFRFTGKEMDEETGLYYYGARYLDPKTSRWISADPAMGDYVPRAPIDDEAKRHNENLPGMGGVFNYVNLHVYHYAGNNPVKLVDPDGETTIINNTKHWIIVRGEGAEIHAVMPGENYKTEDHQGLKAIDGILMHNGSAYKTNDGNKDATFTIIENEDGNLRIDPDSEGKAVNFTGDAIKALYNQSIFGQLLGQKEKSGMYKKGDGTIVGGSWWNSAMKKTGIADADLAYSANWNTKLAEFRKEYPDGFDD
jgi:RHS repeat-associated protein